VIHPKNALNVGLQSILSLGKKNQIGWLILLIILLTVGLVVNKNFNTPITEDEEEKSIHENRGSKNKMNEEAIRDAYRLFVADGYTKGVEDFRTLMKSNEEGRKVAYDLFVTGGYSGGLSDFEELMGAKVASPVEKYSDRAADYFFHFFKVLSMKEIKEGVAYDINNNSLGSFSGEGGREGPWKCYYKDNKLAYEGYYEKGFSVRPYGELGFGVTQFKAERYFIKDKGLFSQTSGATLSSMLAVGVQINVSQKMQITAAPNFIINYSDAVDGYQNRGVDIMMSSTIGVLFSL
jgi:hypothetical protein